MKWFSVKISWKMLKNNFICKLANILIYGPFYHVEVIEFGNNIVYENVDAHTFVNNVYVYEKLLDDHKWGVRLFLEEWELGTLKIWKKIKYRILLRASLRKAET